MKRIILILGLVFSVVAVDAKPQKGPKGKGKALKERFEAAKKKRDAKRGEAKKKGHKHKGPRGEFGKLVRNDEKIKELKKQFAAAEDKIKGKFDRKKFKDATDEEKAALRDKLRASRKEWEVAMKAHRVEVGKRMKEIRKEWEVAMKAHRVEVGKRIKEIREEFKNNRDKVIEGNKPGE